MRVTVVDPPAYTPPYDHSLCAALARRGLDVELATSRFRHSDPPRPHGYERTEGFYRLNGENARAKGLQHPFEMLSLARRLRRERVDVTHFQWLPLPQLDWRLVRRFARPRLATAHELLSRDAGPRTRHAAARALREMDAIVVHSESGRRRLAEAGVPASLTEVVPHGAFEYLTRLSQEAPIDSAAGDLDGRKVVLCFGLVRPHKGVDVLIEAFADAPQDAVLLIVGRPLVPVEPLQRRARELGLGDRARFVPRFIAEAEVPAYFRRADLVVLPHRRAEESGVLFTALAFGRPLLTTDVGGFAEVAAHGAARLVPPGDARALGHAIDDLLGDDRARDELSEAAREAAEGQYSWRRAGELTEALYRRLLEERV